MKNHPLLKELNVVILQCLAATICITMAQSCMPTKKVKPVIDTVAISLQDSLEKASMDADIKASKERFRLQRKAKAEGERKNGN